MFGLKLGKTVSVLRAEACEYFLDPENKEIMTTTA